jgi:hypothetical protein
MTTNKHSVTFDGEPVTREVSIAEVKTYMIRKGFRLANRFEAGEAWTLARVGEVDADTMFAHIDVGKYASEARAIVEVATCLNREPRDVLREIAGDVVTLADAWNALMSVLITESFCQSEGAPYAMDSALDAFGFAVGWMSIARSKGAPMPPEYQRVAHAAEDIAAIALAELRRERTASPVVAQS